MNRKIKALCAGCLSLVLLLSGCGEKGTGDQNASAVNPVEDYVSHKVNATLHQVSVHRGSGAPSDLYKADLDLGT